MVAEIYGRQLDFDDSQFGKVPMYFTVRSALDALVRVTQYGTYGDRQLARLLLNTFNVHCLSPRVQDEKKRKKPFIAIESSLLSTRTITVRWFTRSLGGVILANPPPCLVHLKKYFSSSSLLVSAYYTLGMYAIALRANVICNYKPVVTTGYWYEKVALWLKLNSANTSLPPNTSTIYDFPEDLRVPDLMFYIYFPDDLHRTTPTTRSPFEWKPRMLKIMRMLRGVPMIELSSRMGYDNLLIEMQNITTEILGKTHFDDSKFGNVPMFFTIRSALDTLVLESQHNTFDHGQLAKYLLMTFDTQCLTNFKVTVKEKKKKPFIAIESNLIVAREISAKRFTRSIGGTLLENPPVCLVKLKKHFSSNNPLVSAYYTLGMYVVASKANVILDIKPVVTTGYWYDKLAFWLYLNSANTSLPPNTSTIYDFAEDLRVPDLMFHIHFPDDLHRTPVATRPPSNWKPRKLKIMRMLRGVPMFELNCKMGYDNLLIAMKNITREILGKTRHFSFNY